jgi:hypothetical protein
MCGVEEDANAERSFQIPCPRGAQQQPSGQPLLIHFKGETQ